MVFAVSLLSTFHSLSKADESWKIIRWLCRRVLSEFWSCLTDWEMIGKPEPGLPISLESGDMQSTCSLDKSQQQSNAEQDRW